MEQLDATTLDGDIEQGDEHVSHGHAHERMEALDIPDGINQPPPELSAARTSVMVSNASSTADVPVRDSPTVGATEAVMNSSVAVSPFHEENTNDVSVQGEFQQEVHSDTLAEFESEGALLGAGEDDLQMDSAFSTSQKIASPPPTDMMIDEPFDGQDGRMGEGDAPHHARLEGNETAVSQESDGVDPSNSPPVGSFADPIVISSQPTPDKVTMTMAGAGDPLPAPEGGDANPADTADSVSSVAEASEPALTEVKPDDAGRPDHPSLEVEEGAPRQDGMPSVETVSSANSVQGAASLSSDNPSIQPADAQRDDPMYPSPVDITDGNVLEVTPRQNSPSPHPEPVALVLISSNDSSQHDSASLDDSLTPPSAQGDGGANGVSPAAADGSPDSDPSTQSQSQSLDSVSQEGHSSSQPSAESLGPVVADSAAPLLIRPENVEGEAAAASVSGSAVPQSSLTPRAVLTVSRGPNAYTAALLEKQQRLYRLQSARVAALVHMFTDMTGRTIEFNADSEDMPSGVLPTKVKANAPAPTTVSIGVAADGKSVSAAPSLAECDFAPDSVEYKLQVAFDSNMYPTTAEIRELGNRHNWTEKEVHRFFTNGRRRLIRIAKKEGKTLPKRPKKVVEPKAPKVKVTVRVEEAAGGSEHSSDSDYASDESDGPIAPPKAEAAKHRVSKKPNASDIAGQRKIKELQQTVSSLINDMGGIARVDRLPPFLQLLRQETSRAAQSLLLTVLQQTTNPLCLNKFVRLGGVDIMNDIIAEAQRKSQLDILRIALKALGRVPMNVDVLKSSGIGKVVNQLVRSSTDSDCTSRAQRLIAAWRTVVNQEARTAASSSSTVSSVLTPTSTISTPSPSSSLGSGHLAPAKAASTLVPVQEPEVKRKKHTPVSMHDKPRGAQLKLLSEPPPKVVGIPGFRKEDMDNVGHHTAVEKVRQPVEATQEVTPPSPSAAPSAPRAQPSSQTSKGQRKTMDVDKPTQANASTAALSVAIPTATVAGTSSVPSALQSSPRGSQSHTSISQIPVPRRKEPRAAVTGLSAAFGGPAAAPKRKKMSLPSPRDRQAGGKALSSSSSADSETVPPSGKRQKGADVTAGSTPSTAVSTASSPTSSSSAEPLEPAPQPAVGTKRKRDDDDSPEVTIVGVASGSGSGGDPMVTDDGNTSKRKRVQWVDENGGSLFEVHVFERSSDELVASASSQDRGHEQFLRAQQIEKQRERELMLAQRQASQEHAKRLAAMQPTVRWAGPPRLVDVKYEIAPAMGEESTERDVQEKRNHRVFAAVYISASKIPDSPHEPPHQDTPLPDEKVRVIPYTDEESTTPAGAPETPSVAATDAETQPTAAPLGAADFGALSDLVTLLEKTNQSQSSAAPRKENPALAALASALGKPAATPAPVSTAPLATAHHNAATQPHPAQLAPTHQGPQGPDALFTALGAANAPVPSHVGPSAPVLPTPVATEQTNPEHLVLQALLLGAAQTSQAGPLPTMSAPPSGDPSQIDPTLAMATLLQAAQGGGLDALGGAAPAAGSTSSRPSHSFDLPMHGGHQPHAPHSGGGGYTGTGRGPPPPQNPAVGAGAPLPHAPMGSASAVSRPGPGYPEQRRGPRMDEGRARAMQERLRREGPRPASNFDIGPVPNQAPVPAGGKPNNDFLRRLADTSGSGGAHASVGAHRTMSGPGGPTGAPGRAAGVPQRPPDKRNSQRCHFYGTPTGCKRGPTCPFIHEA